MAERLRPAAPRVALAAIAACAVCAAAAAVESPAQTSPGISVKIASSGSFSETRRTVPIARTPGAGSRVVMSIPPAGMPSLAAGDILTVTAEVEVTTDCLNREPPKQCRGSSYRFNPVVAAQPILAAGIAEVAGPRTLPVGERRKITCRQKPPSRERHCVIVFTAAELAVPDPGALPCAPQCHLNLVIDAHHPDARANDRLIIGSAGPNGSVRHDKGRINVIRTRGADPSVLPPPPPDGTLTTATDTRLVGGLSLDEPPRKAVVFSQPLEDLRAREQIAIRAIVRTGIVRLRHNVNVSAKVIVADRPNATRPGVEATRVALLGGEITEHNGFNCTQITTPCTTDKVGVIGLVEDASQTLYANLVMRIGRVGGRAPGDNLVRFLDGGLQVMRYPAED
jgi:hypothetical protein